MKTKHKIIVGDSRRMKELDNKSTHLIITSPPYWQLKDYGEEKQIGFHDSYEEYINNLNLVWKECYRVLHDGCRLCVNIGDQFARAVYYGRYKVIPIREEIIKFCEIIGFDYMGAVIWQKATTMNTTGGATVMGSFPYPRNGILKIDYEFILIFKKPGAAPIVDKKIKEMSKLTQDEWNTYFQGHWNFNGVRQNDHIAMFPEELPKRLIKMFSFVGDTVLDPFLGSGTTSVAAKNLNRDSIGYEINKNYLQAIKERMDVDSKQLFDDNSYEIVDQSEERTDFRDEINKLPYIFKDPHKLDKKVDPRKIGFGSKIGKDDSKRDEYYIVKEVINPETLVLNNGIKIRLIGIKQNISKKTVACGYLLNKAKGQRVYLKYDNQKHDAQNNLLCYLYLKNKTFVNAHLIKSGLVDVDRSMDYKYKNKFLEIVGKG
ncbi:MAG: DNA methyltransferase [Candidatus Margulisiibacteriota bacterium]